MSEALYERYKEALRRGHVAALRGRFEEAIEAYREAASIATERPLPHTSLGGILLRFGRLAEASAAFDAALERAPRDEAALLGRSEALVCDGRAVEAATTLDLVAQIQEAGGRPSEALDTARRALGLAESKTRRRDVERLERTLGAATGAEPAAVAPGESTAADAADAAEPELEAESEPQPERIAEPEPEPEPAAAEAATLEYEADVALESGDAGRARDALLVAARAYRAVGRHDAALDACYRALAVAPGDTELHLALVELYRARGWHGRAAEKLALLARLAELDDDATAAARIRAVEATDERAGGRRFDQPA